MTPGVARVQLGIPVCYDLDNRRLERERQATMKILHLMLANFYAEGFGYQENLLPRQNMLDGHEVRIIASTETRLPSGGLGYLPPSTYFNENGIKVTRIPYRKSLPHCVARKIRSYVGLYHLIQEFAPDVILHHGVTSYELLTLAKYQTDYPAVKIYADSHEMSSNSAQNLMSKQILHKRFYAPVLRKVLPYLQKILCVTTESMDFLERLYNIPLERMELYPLGGVLFSHEERLRIRKGLRERLGIKDRDVVLVHSGKMSPEKRTADLLRGFSQVQDERLFLLLIGSFTDDVKQSVEPLVQADSRVKCLGWKERTELFQYLCACDLYVQPGSQSATMQQALCCGSAAMLYPRKSHKDLVGESVFYVKTVEDIRDVLTQIVKDPTVLEQKREQSFRLARNRLDYRALASRLYH